MCDKKLHKPLSVDKCWIAMKFCTYIDGSQKMNPADFGDPLTFHLAPPAGQSFHLSNEVFQTLPDRLQLFQLFIRSKFHFVQFFSFWPNSCKTNDIPISLSCTLCSVIISKCWHANKLNYCMLTMVNIIPAKYHHVSILTLAFSSKQQSTATTSMAVDSLVLLLLYCKTLDTLTSSGLKIIQIR